MFLKQVKKEFAQQLITAKFSVIFVLVVILSLVSVIVMHRDYQLRSENYVLMDPQGADTVTTKRPALMSTLVQGLDERLDGGITVNVLGRLELGRGQSSANRFFALFRQLDLQFVVLVVLSLAAVLFSFDMVSREKRQGTLKLMLSNSVGRWRVLLAKWLGALLVVALQAIIAILFCLLYLLFIANAPLDADFYMRTAAFALIAVLYLAVFTGIGLLISTLTHRPATSLIFALLVWAVLVFVIPKAAAFGGKLIAGGDSLGQMEQREMEIWVREVNQSINNPEEYDGHRGMASKVDTLLGHEYRNYLNQAERRVGSVMALSFLSPAGPLNFSSWAAAGTGPFDELRYKREVVRYQTEAHDDAYDAFSVRRGWMDAEEFQARPFVEHQRSLAEAMGGEVLIGIAVLVIEAILLFVFSYFLFVRYDVR